MVAEQLDETSWCFAVFDGHGGEHCSRWSAAELPVRLRQLMRQTPTAHDECESSRRRGGCGAATATAAADAAAAADATAASAAAVANAADAASAGASTSELDRSFPLRDLLLGMDRQLGSMPHAWACGTTALVCIVRFLSVHFWFSRPHACVSWVCFAFFWSRVVHHTDAHCALPCFNCRSACSSPIIFVTRTHLSLWGIFFELNFGHTAKVGGRHLGRDRENDSLTMSSCR